ncbi:LOW QUALITY PROTEIN: 1-aminocyclopropane-1-carboxylate synthase [Colletotrichum tofieldiae]|nr:LOW QUALITY PROTEIN: 1-aminocyclopropane-1-carboxylate synthase [Colletotrichum tofieldiae]
MLEDLASFAAQVPLPSEVFGYSYSTAGGVRLRAALASHLNLTFNPHAPLTSGDVQLAVFLLSPWRPPGRGILTSRPVYGRFELDFGNEMGVEVVYADTTPETCFEPDVVAAFEAALQRSHERRVRIRAVMIVNPNNPLGRCYPRETLVRIMRFCEKHKIHLRRGLRAVCVLVVRVVADLHIRVGHRPRGIIDPDLVHVEYGLAKDFAASGMRLGALVSRNRALHEAFSSVVRFHSPAGPSVAIAAAMFEDREWHDAFISKSRERIAAAYEFVTGWLKESGIGHIEANTGYESDQEREFALAESILEKGVFLHPCEEHCLAPGWFRLVYTQPQSIVGEGLRSAGQLASGDMMASTFHFGYLTRKEV